MAYSSVISRSFIGNNKTMRNDARELVTTDQRGRLEWKALAPPTLRLGVRVTRGHNYVKNKK